MESEKDGMLPFLGTQLLNRAPQIDNKVYVNKVPINPLTAEWAPDDFTRQWGTPWTGKG